jgi:phospholipid/cholesterol/gamma-HCH transport system substrate-binding protein
MEPNARYTLVGGVMLLLMSIVAAAILWLSRATNTDAGAQFAIYFREVSLSGLQVDGAVTMRGIKVGRILSFDFWPQNIELVRVLVELEEEVPVRTDTEAVVQRNLLTGLATIDLVGGSQAALPLERMSSGEEFPVIPQGQTGLDRFQQSLPEVLAEASATVEKAGLFIEDLRAVVSPENRGLINASLRNVEQITSTLNQSDVDLGASLREFGQLSRKATDSLERIDGDISAVLASLHAVINRLGRDAVSTTRQIGNAADSFSGLAQSYKDPRSILFGVDSRNYGPGEGGPSTSTDSAKEGSLR